MRSGGRGLIDGEQWNDDGEERDRELRLPGAVVVDGTCGRRGHRRQRDDGTRRGGAPSSSSSGGGEEEEEGAASARTNRRRRHWQAAAQHHRQEELQVPWSQQVASSSTSHSHNKLARVPSSLQSCKFGHGQHACMYFFLSW